ncbi:hypothetical protein AB0B25_06610 [Nocardia sp. NPDC049190]|uniref:hypothetical protein n=1 Tax=Nocardia sp. NPDC049190 TaxID=3155650 RepID=UPI0033CE86AB
MAKTPTAQAEPSTPTSSIKLPFASASLTVPGPGAVVEVGPVSVTLPTNYLYYTGLGALAIAGTIEWPVAAALGAGGFLVSRVRSRTPKSTPTDKTTRSARSGPTKTRAGTAS